MNRVGKRLCEREIRLAGLAPQQIRVRRVRQAAGYRLLQAWPGFEEAFDRTLTGQVGCVVRIDIGRHQVSRLGIGAGQKHRRHAAHVGGQARCHQLRHGFSCRDQDFATHMAALLHRRQLIFEVDARGTSFDHRLHQLERIEHAAEPRLGIRYDRREVIDIARVTGILALHPLNLVSTGKRVVNASNHGGHRVDWIKRLIRIHLASQIRVTGHLPA